MEKKELVKELAESNCQLVAGKQMEKLLATLETTIERDYLNSLDKMGVIPYEGNDCPMRFYPITKIIRQRGVFMPDKLAMCYRSVSHTAGYLALVITKSERDGLRIYLGTRDPEGNDYESAEILEDSLKGFLPGVRTEMVGQVDLLEGLGTTDLALSCYSGVASFVDDRKVQCIQGLENLLDATADIPAFTAVLLAKHITPAKLDDTVNAFREILEKLMPYEQFQISVTENTSGSVNIGVSTAFTESVTESLARTTGSGQSKSSGKSIGAGAGGNLFGLQIGGNVGTHKNEGTHNYKADTNSRAEQEGSTIGWTINTGITVSQGQSLTFTVRNPRIADINRCIRENIDRGIKAKPHGSWSVSTYFICRDNTTARKLASIYAGTVTGHRSEIMGTGCSLWKNGSPYIPMLLQYLGNYRHPEFQLTDRLSVNASTLVDSNELAIHMSLPLSSTQGFTVSEEATFGRTVITDKVLDDTNSICLGHIQHLGLVYPEKVRLDINRFQQHTLVAGSNGSGKSNVVYHILDCLHGHGINFMVIEPGKGEYRHIFGNNPRFRDVTVYGTDPRTARQLAFNPFTFPEGVLLNEHIEGLCNILNACWPLYAAMPQMLRDAVEQAYRNCGWDIGRSYNPDGIWPGFEDVVAALDEIVDSSGYSSDSKSDYKGAIKTRLSDMCKGICGEIFGGRPVSDGNLFNADVIIDLSRIQSDNTKALLTGLLVMKMDEYRKSENLGINLPLRHVAVIEEAHHLLKRTPTVQVSESANLAGMAVSSIGCCMRQMRTYGQAFIIVDQSPSLLDDVTISNTNTRIVLTLPGRNDIDTVTRSLNLNELQACEVSRLNVGEALVSQTGWTETVRCKVHHYDTSSCGPWTYTPETADGTDDPWNGPYNRRVLEILYRHYVGTADKGLDSGLVEDILRMELPGHKRYRLKQLAEENPAPGPDVCAAMMAVIVGTDLCMNAQRMRDVGRMNRHITQGLLQIPGVSQCGHIPALLDMYMKGCSDMSATPFYENWQLLNVK